MHVQLASGARGVNLHLSLHLLPCIVHASRKCSAETVCAVSSEPSLNVTVISTIISCTNSQAGSAALACFASTIGFYCVVTCMQQTEHNRISTL